MAKKVLVTGGHMTPALAVMQELKQRGWEIVYVGRKNALEGEGAPAQEISEVKRLGFYFVPISTGRLQRSFTAQTIPSLLKIPVGFVQAQFIVLSNKPQAVLSFGGYVALPVVFWSWLLGVPVITHEQTLSPGLANRLIAFMATKICVAFKEVTAYFPENKTLYTGNPLRKEIFTEIDKVNIPENKPVLYATGGNLGAHSINILIEEVLEKLLKRFVVIHQTGNSEKYQDYARLKMKRDRLPVALRNRYLLFEYIDAGRIGSVFKHSDVVVTRAGANMVNELIALTKPALFVPLPWAGRNEQEKNAAYLVGRGGARLIRQNNLTGERLLKQLDLMFRDLDNILVNLKAVRKNFIVDGDKRVADVLESVA